jgi:hypothetical protein
MSAMTRRDLKQRVRWHPIDGDASTEIAIIINCLDSAQRNHEVVREDVVNIGKLRVFDISGITGPQCVGKN